MKLQKGKTYYFPTTEKGRDFIIKGKFKEIHMALMIFTNNKYVFRTGAAPALFTKNEEMYYDTIYQDFISENYETAKKKLIKFLFWGLNEIN